MVKPAFSCSAFLLSLLLPPFVTSSSAADVLSIGNLQVQGMVESTSGGFKFPDGSLLTTAGLDGLLFNVGFVVDNSGSNTGNLFSGAIKFGTSSSGEGIASQRTSGADQNGLELYTNNIARLSILHNGNIGIGNRTPTEALDVNGNIKTSGLLTVANGATVSGSGLHGITNLVSSAGIIGDNNAGGEAVVGRTTSTSVAAGAVVGRNDGAGYGVRGFVATDTSGKAIGVFGQIGQNGSTGSAGRFENTNATNTHNTLEVVSNGQGVIADHSQGNAGNFFADNTNGVGAGVRGEVNSQFGNNGTAGVYGVASGTGGYGGYFEHSNASGYGLTLKAITFGQGVVGSFQTALSANSSTTLEAVTNGLGSAFTATNTNSANTDNTLQVVSNGVGTSDHSQGNAGNFFLNNINAIGAGVRGEVNTIFSTGGAAGVFGVASGTGGYGGYFEHSSASGTGPALYVITRGLGYALIANQGGTSGDIAVFRSLGSDKARIDRTGKGFFNGGTQNSGADVAEAFDVEGSPTQYEPGDVLEISASADRTVTKSATPYSTMVAGVYATKPGVLLTEESIDGDLSSKVPLGVIGVIPTKVCSENGAISRGDLLVTSSTPGYAMKGDQSLIKPGQLIGKALEGFGGRQFGKIRVLINIR